MTREEIEKLEEIEPYCFETDKEEQWYKIGLKEGLETADNNPKWINVNDSLPCDFENLLENETLTVKVLVVLQWNEDPARKHIEICDMYNSIGSFKVDWFWNCSGYYTVTHWMPLPNFPEE